MLIQTDIVIIGSGFGGSLLSLLLNRLGFRCVLVDRASHPRFAIGESSTPAANLILRQLAWKYDLPRLAPLARFGTWQATYPHLTCGLKRGFSYFKHHRGEVFLPREDHANELLVAASSQDAVADTHWLRSDVDQFLVEDAQNAGAIYFDHTELSVDGRDPWLLTGQRWGETLQLEAGMLVDASGEAGFLRKHLRLEGREGELRTNSRSLFAHFHDVSSWHAWLSERGARVNDHPFCCDHAALHQVLDEGWMWQLRFQNGVTSVGIALDAARCPPYPGQTPLEEWKWWLGQYPSLKEPLEKAVVVRPSTGLHRTGRIQRWTSPAAGLDWVLLPNTAGFIDPLHSTGIAHTLSGVERLAGILAQHREGDSLHRALADYSDAIHHEIAFIDRLVSACYRSLHEFPLFVGAGMMYFAAATNYERRRRMEPGKPPSAFLGADDPEVLRAIAAVESSLDRALASDCLPHDLEQFQASLRDALNPLDHVGLFRAEIPHMHAHTALDDVVTQQAAGGT
jgi:tetracycline 7-halogenase / FADH2 O2-dependent halogenase